MIRLRNILSTIAVLIMLFATVVLGLCTVEHDCDDCCAASCDCGVVHCACGSLNVFLTSHTPTIPSPATGQYQFFDELLMLPVVLVPIFQPPRA
jgi:hypothetical protein